MELFYRLLVVVAFFLPTSLWCLPAATPDAWVPARWQGGPLEVARRVKDKTLPADAALRDMLAKWYEPATLGLLEGTPVNCLLVTWSAGGDAEVEQRQRRLVKDYAREAHMKGIAIVGLVYPGSEPASFVLPAAEAELDGLVLEGDFPGGEAFVRQVEKDLRARNHAAIVVPFLNDVSVLRKASWPVLATAGSWPRSRLLTEMGIRAAPSSEPWLDSNLWLLRSLQIADGRKPVWLGHLPTATSANDYARAVADAAIAGGRWVVALDDGLRAGLLRKEAAALETWRRIASYLAFYRAHADWRAFAATGRLGIVLDKAGENREISDEYLNLIARRQVPYRVMDRGGLSSASLAGLSAVVAIDLSPPSDAERHLLQAFAENGGLVVTSHAWGGDVPKGQPFAEFPTGKGRVAVYADDLPDPEGVSKDIKDLMGEDHLGVRVFNMSSVLTYVSSEPAGKRLLVQLLNYSTYPADSMTVRVSGAFQTARLLTPENGTVDLTVEKAGTASEIAIPNLLVGGALLLE